MSTGPFILYGSFILIATGIVSAAMFWALTASKYQHVQSIVLFFLTAASYLATFPLRVLITRAVARDSADLHFNPFTASRDLFNRAERSNPFKICLAPGLAFSFLISDITYVATAVLRQFVFLSRQNGTGEPVKTGSIVTSIAWDIGVALVLCPLETINVRLSLQEYGPKSNGYMEMRTEPGTANDDGTDPSAPPDYEAAITSGSGMGAGKKDAKENVISLRSEATHVEYRSWMDCARRIRAEEGLTTFWRGWYISAFFYILVHPSIARTGSSNKMMVYPPM